MFIGKPSYEKFQEKSILNSRATKRIKQESPKFYLCARVNGNGWKWDTSKSRFGNILKEMCIDSKSLTDLDACIENNSYTNEEMFVRTVDGNGTDMSTFWEDELTLTQIGKSENLNSFLHIGNDISFLS